MIQQTINDALNKQMNAEFYSSWLYLSMSGWCYEQNWNGFAHWLLCQAEEECGHGMRIFRYIDEREGHYLLDVIPGPNNDWVSLQTLFEAAYAHEQAVTVNINKLVDLARQEEDRATVVFLNWFVMEQVEEEKQTNDILRHLETFGDHIGPVFLLDRELGLRKKDTQNSISPSV